MFGATVEARWSRTFITLTPLIFKGPLQLCLVISIELIKTFYEEIKMSTKANLKACFYLRSATGDIDNLKRQKEKLETFISQRPELANSSVEIYTDEIQSGLRPGPEFLRMKQDIMK